MPDAPDYDTVLHSLRSMCGEDGSVYEFRSLAKHRGLASTGYFNSPELGANFVCNNADNEGIAGIYTTLNPVIPDALSRASNYMVSAKAGSFTKDCDIVQRRIVLLDFDPVRISGVSSTDAEHEHTLEYIDEVVDDLYRWHGFPWPSKIDSGNGGHGKYALHPLENMPDSTDLIRTFLRVMGARYSTPSVTIDTTVFNASRIARLPGTIARKGDNTPDRPHRRSRIIQDYDPTDLLSADTIRRFISKHEHLLLKNNRQQHRPVNGGKTTYSYPVNESLYRTLNRTALERFHEWVPEMLGEIAYESGEGYRISSDSLGRDLEEAISITAMGIKDFGVADMGDATEGRRTPVSLLAELRYEGDKVEAATRLAMCLNCPVNEFQPVTRSYPKSDTPITMPEALMGLRPFARAHDFTTIMHNPITPVTYLIEGLVANNTHTVLSAPPKTGKSTMIYSMALHAVFGRPFLGRRTTQCNVLWIALEEREFRFHRKVMEQLDNLEKGDWPDLTPEMKESTFKRLRFFTLDSREKDDVKGILPVGPDGAAEIKRILEEAPDEPWLVIIEPVQLFHVEQGGTKNLNKLEYEQIEIINGIVNSKKYTCAIMTVKHDRKSPPGGVRGLVNVMESISGSIAQSGAPDSQIQFVGKGFDNRDNLNWLIVQSRDFGKVKIPVVSDGTAWVQPPADMDIPDFEEWMTEVSPTVGRSLKDPQVDAKMLAQISTADVNGLTAQDIATAINLPYQIVLRRLKFLATMGQVYRNEFSYRNVRWTLTPIARLPDVL